MIRKKEGESTWKHYMIADFFLRIRAVGNGKTF
jgi:hypothetical protein